MAGMENKTLSIMSLLIRAFQRSLMPSAGREAAGKA